MVYAKQPRNNKSPLPVAYAKESRNNTLPSPVVPAKTVTQQCVALTGGKRKNNHATICCLHQWYPQKQLRDNTLSSSMENAKKTRNKTLPSPVVHGKQSGNTLPLPVVHANSHTTTRRLHQWQTEKRSRNNTLPSPVVYTKQTCNNTLPSPVVHAKNSHATTRCLHRWYMQIVYPTIRCLDQRSRNNNMLSSPVEFAKTAPKQVAFTSGIQ